jgi:Na+/proline symporter
MWFWSIPQQDVFQRVLSAKNENIAKWWSIIWWSLYFIFAFFPITLWYAAFVVAPDLIEKVWDSQLVLPTLILESIPLIIHDHTDFVFLSLNFSNYVNSFRNHIGSFSTFCK